VGPARYGVAAVEKAYYYLLAHRWECGLLDPAEKALGFRCQELDNRFIVSLHRTLHRFAFRSRMGFEEILSKKLRVRLRWGDGKMGRAGINVPTFIKIGHRHLL
jgi:hypothetical protein